MERPRSHVLEDESRASFDTLMAQLGWVAVDIFPDYGEDLLVYVYANGDFTGEILFVQLKATDRTFRRGLLRFSLKMSTLRRWEKLSLPLLLIVWCANDKQFRYHDVLADLYRRRATLASSKYATMTIRIAEDQKVDSHTLLKVVKHLVQPLSVGHSLLLKDLAVTLRSVEKVVSQMLAWQRRIDSTFNEYDTVRRDYAAVRYGEMPFGHGTRFRRDSYDKHEGSSEGFRCWDEEERAFYDVFAARMSTHSTEDLVRTTEAARVVMPGLADLQRQLLSHGTGQSLWTSIATEFGRLAATLAVAADTADEVVACSSLADYAHSHSITGNIGTALHSAPATIERIKWLALEIISAIPLASTGKSGLTPHSS